MTLWREELIPVNLFTRPGIPLRVVRNIVIHYTANPGASAANHVIYFGKTLPRMNEEAMRQLQAGEITPAEAEKMIVYASAHIFVDPTDTVLLIPLNEIAYHASQANPYSIGVELCIERDGMFHPAAVKRAAAIVAELCEQYGLNPQRDVIRHYDVTGKICPKPYVDYPIMWDDFRRSVDQIMKTGKAEEDMGDELKLPTEGWGALAKSLQKAYDNGLLGDYRFVEKAYNGTLTRSELDVANNIIIVNSSV